MDHEIQKMIDVTENAPRRDRSWVLLLCATAFYFCANLQKVVVPGATFTDLQACFPQLDAAAITRFGAAFFYTYAILQLVAGPLADRFSGIWVIAVSGSLLVLGSVGSALTISPALLLFCRIFTAAGAAMIYLSIIQLAGQLCKEKLPITLGAIFIIGYAGSVVGTTPFVAGIQRVGYAQMMLTAGFFSLLVYIIFLVFFIPSKKPIPQTRGSFSFRDLRSAFSTRNVLCFFVISIPFAISYALLTIIGKKFLQDYADFSSIAAGNVLLALTIIAAVNGLVAAWVSRALNNRKLPILWFSAAGTLIIQILFVLTLNFNCRSSWWLIMLFCLGSVTGNIAPVYVAYLREHNEDQHFATVVGVSNAIAYAFTAFFGSLCGNLLDAFSPTVCNGIKVYGRNSYLLIFAVFTAFAAVATVLMYFLMRKDHEVRQ